MQTWLQFLTRHGARINDAGIPEVLDFNSVAPHEALRDDFIAPLTSMGLLRASGDDAARFLHAQLTNDVERLQDNEARLAGYCSPKGRLIATLLMWKQDGAVFLQLPQALSPAVLKRLRMYVLRAKVVLADAGEDVAALGIVGERGVEALRSWFPSIPEQPFAKITNEAGTLIRVPDAHGRPRFQWVASSSMLEQAWPQLTSTLTPAGTAAWEATEILAGLPHVVSATQEQFVPQMINFELIGGVNFRKGCYPGQEIVARSQYLGKLKRRMVLAEVGATGITAGTEVFSLADAEQACGMIVNAAAHSATASLCLVEVKMAALEAGSIHVGSVDGPALAMLPMPYALTDPA